MGYVNQHTTCIHLRFGKRIGNIINDSNRHLGFANFFYPHFSGITFKMIRKNLGDGIPISDAIFVFREPRVSGQLRQSNGVT